MSEEAGAAAAAAAAAHVVLVPFKGQGNINPLLRLAKRLASKGLLVTFFSALFIGRQISSVPSNSLPSTPGDPPAAVPVCGGRLRFEFFSDGWEDDDPRRDDDPHSFQAQLQAAGSRALTDLVRRLQAETGRPVACIVSNPFLPWVLDLAEGLGVPSALFWIQSCAVFSTYYSFVHSLAEFPTADDPGVSVKLPGLPELTPDELPTFVLPTNPLKVVAKSVLAQFKNIRKAGWILGNTFEELEREAIGAISAATGLRIVPIGPLVDGPEPGILKGDLWRTADCMSWLDLHEPSTVVYAAVGSVAVLTREEVTEIAKGLLSCRRPFLWVVREGHQNLVPQGFIEGAGGRGMVVSWSPQERVLSHRSTGCFVTHCGWNSALEAMMAGVPVVAYPRFGDQQPNAKRLVDVYGVGVALRAPVKGEELDRCVGEVMEGERAEKIKGKVLKWKEAAREAVGGCGSSEKNLEAFVDEVVRRAAG